MERVYNTCSILQVPTTQLAKMSIALKLVELTADILEIFFIKSIMFNVLYFSYMCRIRPLCYTSYSVDSNACFIACGQIQFDASRQGKKKVLKYSGDESEGAYGVGETSLLRGPGSVRVASWEGEGRKIN